MKVVKKGNVEKKIKDEKLLADYILAGWKIVDKNKTQTQTEIKNKDFLK